MLKLRACAMRNHFLDQSNEQETLGLSVSHRLKSYSSDELNVIISSFLRQHEYTVLSHFLDHYCAGSLGIYSEVESADAQAS